MSSTVESLKQSAQEPASDEPGHKKVKLAGEEPKGGGGEADNKNSNSTDIKNGTKTTTATTEKIASIDSKNIINNNNNNNNVNNKTPSKVAKGKEESEVDEEDDDNSGNGEDDSANYDGVVFDPKIAKSLEQVELIQAEIFNLNEKASEEILKVEQKFNQLRKPHFEKRNELLKEIPNFWLTSLANHPTIAPMIESAEDEDCLHYMVNLDVEEFEDIKSGYRLKLHFVENPYIKNEVIIKEFQVVNPEEVMSTTTPIEFKNTPQGMNLKRIVESSLSQTNSNRDRRSGQQLQQSFFAWLIESCETGQDEIAEILKDQIWPNPLELFFASPENYEEASDEDDDDDDDDESDDEDEEIPDEGITAEDDEEIDDEEGDDDEEEDDEEEVYDEEFE